MSETDETISIAVTAGVSAFTGEPFCHVLINGVTSGQLSPNELREMAMSWLAVAEAAESDAAVFAALTDDVGLSKEEAGRFVQTLRVRRES